MGPNENVLREAYAQYAGGNIDKLLAMFAEDVVLKPVGAPNRIDHAGEWHGIEGARDFLAAIADNWTFEKSKCLR